MRRARHSYYNFCLLYVRACVHAFGFVRAILFTFKHEFQNNLAQLFSLRRRSDIRNLC